jgi:hypothetical protein
MHKPFSWVSNHTKLERARGVLGPDATEEALKAKYIEYGGLVLPEYEIPEAPEVSLDKPKKRKKAE